MLPELSSLNMRPDDRAEREGTPLTWDPRKERERGMAPDWWADLARWYWRNSLTIWVAAAVLGWAYFAFIHQPGIPPEPWIDY